MTALLEQPAIGVIRCPYCGVPDPDPVPPSLLMEPKPGMKRIAVVGEAPGQTEKSQKRPFVGYSGKLLRATMKATGIDDTCIFFTNVCCCRPTKVVMDNGKRKIKDRTPTAEEMATGRPRLMKELIEFNPDVIIAVGNSAMIGLFNLPTCKITTERGLWRTIDIGGKTVPVMPTIHPAALLRDAAPFRDFTNDLLAVNKPIPTWSYPNTIVISDTSYYPEALESILQLARTNVDGLPKPYPVAIDIETDSLSAMDGKILCISISPTSDTAFVIAEDILNTYDTRQFLTQLSMHPELLCYGHNWASFDRGFIQEYLGIKFPLGDDTLLMHYILDERLGTQGLKACAQNYYGIPDYSQAVKKYVIEEGATYADIPRPELYQYAAMDTAVTRRLYPDLKRELDAEPSLWRPYNMLKRFAEMLAEIEKNGALLDPEHFQKLDDEWVAEIAGMVIRLQEITGRKGIKPRSAKQIGEVLFDEKGMESIETTKAGNRATGKKILAKLKLYVEAGSEEEELLDLILDARSRSQNLATYVRGLPKRRHSDGRVRPHLMLHGTEPGRLACRNPNLQNVPKHGKVSKQIRDGFIASPGKVFIEVDYSTLELRIAAWYSDDPAMKQAFIDGIDIHRVVGGKIFKCKPEEVTRAQRHISKFVDFGIVYGRQAQSLAEEELKCSVKEAQKFIDEFLAGFPHLHKWMQETRAKTLETNYVESAFGRRRRWDLILNNNKNDIEREAVNTPIQSMASDLNVNSMCRINAEIDHSIARILFPVHDSILIECDIDRVNEVAAQVVAIMEDVESYGIEKKFPFKAEAAVGMRWGSMTEIGDLHKAGLDVDYAMRAYAKDTFWHLEESPNGLTEKWSIAV